MGSNDPDNSKPLKHTNNYFKVITVAFQNSANTLHNVKMCVFRLTFLTLLPSSSLK